MPTENIKEDHPKEPNPSIPALQKSKLRAGGEASVAQATAILVNIASVFREVSDMRGITDLHDLLCHLRDPSRIVRRSNFERLVAAKILDENDSWEEGNVKLAKGKREIILSCVQGEGVKMGLVFPFKDILIMPDALELLNYIEGIRDEIGSIEDCGFIGLEDSFPKNAESSSGEVSDHPIFIQLREDYEKVPEPKFAHWPGKFYMQKLDFDKIAQRITPQILEAMGTLENPRIYGINDDGELIVGDREIPQHTLNQDFDEALINTRKEGLDLLKDDEYSPENTSWSGNSPPPTSWLRNSKNTPNKNGTVSLGRCGGRSYQISPKTKGPSIGAFRVVRIYLGAEFEHN